MTVDAPSGSKGRVASLVLVHRINRENSRLARWSLHFCRAGTVAGHAADPVARHRRIWVVDITVAVVEIR